MKPFLISLMALGWVGALATLAMSQTNNGISQGELASFNQFLTGHPAVAQQLAGNPALVNNPGFSPSIRSCGISYGIIQALVSSSTSGRDNSCLLSCSADRHRRAYLHGVLTIIAVANLARQWRGSTAAF
jgi:hypothetical protein